ARGKHLRVEGPGLPLGSGGPPPARPRAPARAGGGGMSDALHTASSCGHPGLHFAGAVQRCGVLELLHAGVLLRQLLRRQGCARCLRALFLRALAIRHSSPPRLRRKPNRRRQSGEVPRPAGPVPGVWLPPGGPLRPGRVEAPRGHRRARAGQARRLRASGWRNGTAGSRRRRAAAGASGSRGGEGLRG
ncbi:unnamed protein product, partial [Prorocentrum cordatum]